MTENMLYLQVCTWVNKFDWWSYEKIDVRQKKNMKMKGTGRKKAIKSCRNWAAVYIGHSACFLLVKRGGWHRGKLYLPNTTVQIAGNCKYTRNCCRQFKSSVLTFTKKNCIHCTCLNETRVEKLIKEKKICQMWENKKGRESSYSIFHIACQHPFK